MMRFRPSKLLSAAIAIAIATVTACDAYARTNPYDPAVPVEVTISGPDTLSVNGQIGQYRAVTVPALPDTAIHWQSANSDLLQFASPGAFENTFRVPVWPATATVRIFALIGAIDTVGNNNGALGPAPPVKIYRHTGYKDVVVTQRP
jgi:hypothetical protein